MLSALKTKRARAGLVVLALLAFTGAAVAYFTATGSGSGSATVGNSSPMTITATIAPGTGGLVPGGNAADVKFQVNNSGNANQYVTSVSLNTVTAYTNSSQTTQVPGCQGSWFTMSSVTEDQTVNAGATTAMPNDGQLSFNDNGANQDACKGAYLVATFNSN